jgi:CHAD domain-containing protein
VASWRSEIRRVTLTLGAARDTDVQIASLRDFFNRTPEKGDLPGVNRLILRLSQHRAKLQQNVILSMEKLKSSGLLVELTTTLLDYEKSNRMKCFSLPLYQLAFINISKRLDILLSFEAFLYREECVSELHAMRIAAKRLRYTLENFSTLFPDELKIPLQTARKTQDYLGNIHDCDVWSVFLMQFSDDERKRVVRYTGSANSFNFLQPGILHFQENRLLERQMCYQQFKRDWQDWQQGSLWEQLRQTIRQPLIPNFYSPNLGKITSP